MLFHLQNMMIFRLKASQMANDGKENVDLRELLPNYVAPDSQVMKEDMVRKLTEETSNVYESISVLSIGYLYKSIS